MKTVGIIGGFGPETTSKFYLEIISGCKKINRIKYPRILVESVSYPFSIEQKAIIRGGGEENLLLPYLLDAAKNLEKAGADFLVLPCNSLHVFIKDIRNSVEIPVLSILEETSKFLKTKDINKVGVIATNITIQNRLYEKVLSQNNISQAIPEKSNQVKIGKLIHKLVSGKYDNKDCDFLTRIIKDFSERKIRHVILACTDLQLLTPKVKGVKTYDTMKILADATIKNIIK